MPKNKTQKRREALERAYEYGKVKKLTREQMEDYLNKFASEDEVSDFLSKK